MGTILAGWVDQEPSGWGGAFTQTGGTILGGFTGNAATGWGARLRSLAPPPAPDPLDPPAQNAAELTAELWNESDTTLIRAVTEADGHRVKDAVSNLGAGQLVVPTQSTAEQVAANQLADGRHIRFRFRDREPVSQVIVGEDAVEVSTDPGALTRTILTNDKRIVLNNARVATLWDDNPFVEVDTRTFGPFSPETPTAGRKKATVVQPAIALAWQIPNTDPPFFQPWEPPRGWASLLTPIIQPRPGILMPAGRWATGNSFNLPAGWYMIQAVGWDRCELHVQGTKFAEQPEEPANGWFNPIEKTFYWHGGVMHVGLLVEKYNRPWPGNLPGTLANFGRRSLASAAIYQLPDQQATVTPAMKVAQTNGNWWVLDYPSRLPTPTAGRIMRQLVTEGKLNGIPAHVSLGFSDTHDSDGRPWAPHDGVTFNDSNGVGDAAVQLAALGFESKMSAAGYELRMWNPAQFTGSTPIRLSNARRSTRYRAPNQLIVKWSGGRFREPASVANPIQETFSAGDVRSEQAARGLARAHLEQLQIRADRWTATPELVGADAGGMYDGWRPRSWVGPVAGNDLRVESITMQRDQTGRVGASLELQSPGEFAVQQIVESLARIGPGVGAPSTSKIRWLHDGTTGGFVQEESISEFSQGQVVTEGEDPQRGRSTVHTCTVPTRITLIRFTAVGAPLAPQGVQVRVRRNGVNLDPFLFLPQGKRHAVYLPAPLVFNVGDQLSVATIVTSPGAGLISVSFHAAVAAPFAVKPAAPLPWL